MKFSLNITILYRYNQKERIKWQIKCLYVLSNTPILNTQGVDIEKYTRGLFEYVKEAFGEFQPQMSEPGTIPDMPDYLDIVLCKKDGSIFYESDILRRAVNIPHDCQMGGLVLEIFIQNCDGTRYKKRHAYPKPWCNHKANGKSDMRKLKIHKTITKRNLNNQEGKDSEGIRIPELRPQIDFHDFLRQLSHDIRKI